MIAFCRLCGLGFHSLEAPERGSVIELSARAQAHLISHHPDVVATVAMRLAELSAVITARALDWGRDAKAVEAVLAELRSELMTLLARDSS